MCILTWTLGWHQDKEDIGLSSVINVDIDLAIAACLLYALLRRIQNQSRRGSLNFGKERC